MTKVSELERFERPCSMAVHSTGSQLLHISDEVGSRKLDEGGRSVLLGITRCNIVLKATNAITELLGDYKICKRCGTREEFYAVAAEHKRYIREQERRARETQEEFARAREARRQERSERAERLTHLIKSRFPPERHHRSVPPLFQIELNDDVMHVTFEGRRFLLREIDDE